MSQMLTLNGFDKQLERLQEMGRNIDEAAEKSLMQSATRVTVELEKGIARHHDTGRTEDHLIEKPKVVSSRGKLAVKVGFTMPEGLPARYINKGVPTIEKDPFIDRALNKSKLKKEREAFFANLMK